MSDISEYRRLLGIVATEALNVKTDLIDITAEYNEKLEKLQKQANELYMKIDDALDKN